MWKKFFLFTLLILFNIAAFLSLDKIYLPPDGLIIWHQVFAAFGGALTVWICVSLEQIINPVTPPQLRTQQKRIFVVLMSLLTGITFGSSGYFVMQTYHYGLLASQAVLFFLMTTNLIIGLALQHKIGLHTKASQRDFSNQILEILAILMKDGAWMEVTEIVKASKGRLAQTPIYEDLKDLIIKGYVTNTVELGNQNDLAGALRSRTLYQMSEHGMRLKPLIEAYLRQHHTNALT